MTCTAADKAEAINQVLVGVLREIAADAVYAYQRTSSKAGADKSMAGVVKTKPNKKRAKRAHLK
jgi:hypothetical protein